jgi:2-(1,2-epoxy-1,2-dihydrophenyl)acetyl-CoA isomerase
MGTTDLEFDRVRLRLDGQVAVLTLTHPEVMNALSPQMLAGIGKALDAIDDPANDVRCVLLTGEGRAFCTGANLQERSESADTIAPRNRAGATLETQFHPVLRRLRDLHCPIVAAVNGPAAGAGMSFALMGDLVFAARSAYFLQAFRRIGLVPDCGATWLLPRLIGRVRAIELSLLGERLPAQTALEWGLVNRVVPAEELITAATALAREVMWAAPLSVAAILDIGRRTAHLDPIEAMAEIRGYDSYRAAVDSADAVEGNLAYSERRPPVWKGR